MKTTIFVLLLLVIPLYLYADFQRDVPLERTQPDGTKIKLLATGDEFYGMLRDEQGYTVVNDPDTGYDVYALKQDGKLIPSDCKVGIDDPSIKGLQPNLVEDVEVVRTKVSANKAVRVDRQTDDRSRTVWSNLAVFIEVTGINNWEYTANGYDIIFNSGSISARNFFLEESDNQENIYTHFAPPDIDNIVQAFYDDSHTSGYYYPYSQYNTIGYTTFAIGWDRINYLFAEAINYLATHFEIPLADYDADNDGYVDNVTFILEGDPYQPGDVHWPQSGTLTYPAYINGNQVSSFNIVCETSYTGTICHELSHSIGFPDLYREDSYLTDFHPVGSWDVMDEHDSIPTHSLVYMKYRYGGWCIPPNLMEPSTFNSLTGISIEPFSAARFSSTDSDEYCWAEYRKQVGSEFDSHLPGSGLIFYRVNSQADGEGNLEAPPDEVYVYRPDGTLTENGLPTEAFFSSESGRTEFHSATDPSPFLSDGQDGGLSVTGITSSEYNTISFYMTTLNRWTGAVSSNWSVAANWLYGVPDADEKCFIPGNVTNHPVVSSAANCKDLYLDSGASLTLQNTLTVHGDLTSRGAINIPQVTALNIYGSAIWKSGSTVTMASDDCYIETRGNMTFESGNDINSATGRWMFSDSITSPNSILTINGDAEISVLQSYKSSPNYLEVQGTPGAVLTVHNGIYVNNGKYFRSSFPGTIDIKNTVTIQSGGLFQCDAGTVKFSGPLERIISVSHSAGHYFWNVEVAMDVSTTLYFGTITNIKNNLTISSGYFDPNNNTLYVGGNWTNSIGNTAFIEGTGQVSFYGQQPSTCYGERFNTLVLNKYETEQLIIPNGAFVRIAQYDWTDGLIRVDGGELMIDDLVDNGVYGKWQVDSGVASLNQDIAGLIDINGSITMNGGIMYIEGGSQDPRLAYFAAASLTMSDGIIDFKYKGVRIPSTAYGLTFSCTGGTVRTEGSILVSRPNVHIYNLTMEMYGPADATLYVVDTSSLGNLKINKTSGRTFTDSPPARSMPAGERNEPLRTNTVTLTSSLAVGYTLNIAAGTFNVNGYNVTAYDGVVISGNLQMASGVIDTYTGDFVWENGSTTNVTGGSIICGGFWYFNEGASAHLEAAPVTIAMDSDHTNIYAFSVDCWFGDLNLHEYYGEEVMYNLITDGNSALNILGTLTIGISPGTSYTHFNIGSGVVRVSNNVNVYDGSKVIIGPDGILSVEDGKNVIFYSGSALEAVGAQDHPARITHQTGYFLVSIEAGATIGAQYAIFEYMTIFGLLVKDGSFVDENYPFNYCTFQNGSYHGSLITIDNAQEFTVYGAVFPTNTWEGTYNVRKTTNQGMVTFSNASGAFAGESYDNDVNNRIIWAATNCDLDVVSYSADPAAPYVCDPVTISATIRNNSVNPTIAPVRVDVYYNRASLPDASEPGDDFAYLDPLDPASSDIITFPAATTDVVGPWQTWFRVDRLDEITETNETNNGSGPLSITWNGLPPVETPDISYDTFTGMVMLSWTYPLWVDGYNIYHSDNPMGPFTEQAGTSTVTFFSGYESGEYKFYRVKAYRELP